MKREVGNIIRPDGAEIDVLPANNRKFTLQELQGIVGGNIEVVRMLPGNGHKTMYVNEDGKFLKMERNDKATKKSLIAEFDYIVGPAVIVRSETT